ncbi:hypothetical protein SVIO_003270 [Streptomyces violaceusniger]|uniref:Uncharacterized protein n=1 Tax=Streptomyces violaceusniger TaxID=68280 RepID=A0A4D4KNC6_STRVO|nr:hypothetical protein SVIO_003270 [Streptomyces violaceusniger]
MKLLVSPEARGLGVRHSRAWRLTADTSLLGGDGLTAEQVAAACRKVVEAALRPSLGLMSRG